jgi:lysophospholipase L1-like esterase
MHQTERIAADAQRTTALKAGRLRQLAARLALVTASLFLALLIGEVVIRLANPGFPGFRLPQVEHQPAAGMGFEMIPSQRTFTGAHPVSTNARGFRGPEIVVSRPTNGKRVLCLGDSITFGCGEADESTYPRQLEQLLNGELREHRWEVINAGVQRYFTYQEIDQLRLRGLDLQPDLVTLGLYINDMGVRPPGDYSKEYEYERERAATAFHRRLPWVYLALKNSALVTMTQRAVLQRLSPRTNQYASPEMRAVLEEITPEDEELWQAMAGYLGELAEMSSTHGFTALVVAIPGRAQVVADYPNSAYPRRALEICESLGLPAIDICPSFKAAVSEGQDPYQGAWGNHLSDVGHRIVAQRMADWIRDRAE